MEMVVVKDKNGNEYKVYLDEMTYGQRCKVLSKSMKSKVSKAGIDAEVDVIELERNILIESIVDIEPKYNGSKNEFIESLPVSEAVKIVKVATELNPLGI